MQRPFPHKATLRWLLLSAGFVLAACSQPSDSADAGANPPGSMGDMAVPPLPLGAIDLNSGQISLGSGVERTVCVTQPFPITTAVDVTQIATRQMYTHHVIFYKYQIQQGANPPPVNSVPQDCPPLDVFGNGMWKVPMFIGESADQTQNVLTLPPGVAYHIEPGDYYTIEVHVINALPTDLNLSVDVILTPAPPNTKVQYADMLFYSNSSGLDKKYDGINNGLPPMASTTIDPGFGTVRTTFNVFGVTTHQHHLGTGITVYKSTGASDPGTMLFTNSDWQHPALYRLPDAAPLTFKSGEGLRWVCSYDNTTTNYVTFGESAVTDEMCIIWGYYYPSAGFQIVWN